MTETQVRKLARRWLKNKRIPRGRQAKARLAAQFVDYLGTMNQPDRTFESSDKYATDDWVEHETQDKSTEWKKDERNEMGFGIAKASKRQKALAATKLAFLTLGSDMPDSVLEVQGRDFMAMPVKSLVASIARIRKANKSGEGVDENVEFDVSDEDMADDLEIVTDVGEHEDEDMEESLEEASVDEDGVEEAIGKLDKDIKEAKKAISKKTKKRKSQEEKNNEEKERSAASEKEETDKKEAEVSDDEIDKEVEELLAQADEEEDNKEKEEEASEIETEVEEENDEDEDEETEVSEDDENLDQELASLFEDDSKKEKKSSKKRVASKNVKKLGRVTKPSSVDSETAQLSKLWPAPPKINFDDLSQLET